MCVATSKSLVCHIKEREEAFLLHDMGDLLPFLGLWTKNTPYYTGIEFKDFILGFRQSTFLCTTLKCIEKFRIPFIKSGIPASNLGSSEARNPAKFTACYSIPHDLQVYLGQQSIYKQSVKKVKNLMLDLYESFTHWGRCRYTLINITQLYTVNKDIIWSKGG